MVPAASATQYYLIPLRHRLLGCKSRTCLVTLIAILALRGCQHHRPGNYLEYNSRVYLIGALVVGLTEESIFRGALFAAFKKAGVGDTALIVVSALIFAAFHLVNGLAGGNLIALVFQVLFTFG